MIELNELENCVASNFSFFFFFGDESLTLASFN